jgi:hypothetical protein
VSKNSVAKGKYFGPLNTKGAHIKCCAIGEICGRIFRIFKRKGQLSWLFCILYRNSMDSSKKHDFSQISLALFYHFALKVCEEKNNFSLIKICAANFLF